MRVRTVPIPARIWGGVGAIDYSHCFYFVLKHSRDSLALKLVVSYEHRRFWVGCGPDRGGAREPFCFSGRTIEHPLGAGRRLMFDQLATLPSANSDAEKAKRQDLQTGRMFKNPYFKSLAPPPPAPWGRGGEGPGFPGASRGNPARPAPRDGSGEGRGARLC